MLLNLSTKRKHFKYKSWRFRLNFSAFSHQHRRMKSLSQRQKPRQCSVNQMLKEPLIKDPLSRCLPLSTRNEIAFRQKLYTEKSQNSNTIYTTTEQVLCFQLLDSTKLSTLFRHNFLTFPTSSSLERQHLHGFWVSSSSSCLVAISNQFIL